MIPKVQNCIDALASGVRSVHILNSTLDRPPLLESLHTDPEIGMRTGTLIVRG
jgi:acetylglutamate kinase